MTVVERAIRGAKNDLRLHALGVFSVAVAFVCLGATLLAVVNVEEVRSRWASLGRASVYIKRGATETEVAAIERARALHPHQAQVPAQCGCHGLDLTSSARCPGTGDQSDLADDHGRVFDEDTVGVVRVGGDLPDLVTSSDEMLAIDAVLCSGEPDVDRRARVANYRPVV